MIDKSEISVVVPMYNAEKFLSLCIESILNQTFKNFELILIDDCSTDDTLKIAESFDDPRIKILRNEKNLGNPGPVRNVGIKNSCGNFIYFMDNDDFILPQALETMFEAIQKNNSDVVYSTQWLAAVNPNFDNPNDIKCKLVKEFPASEVSKNLMDRVWDEFILCHTHVAPWLFMHRKNFLLENNIRFPNEVAEDVFFTLDVIWATDKIKKIEIPLYIWRERKESASHRIDRLSANIKSVLALYDYVSEKFSQLGNKEFTNAATLATIRGVIKNYVNSVIEQNGGFSHEIISEMIKAFEPRFGKDSMFVALMLQLYAGKSINKK